MSDKDMVTFLMPDGTKISNDPRFGLGEALQKQLDSEEYTGDAGTPRDEFDAQTSVTHVADLNSGQPGVGENATQEDPTKAAYGPLGSDAQRIQAEDMAKAKEAGASPKETSVEDPEPVDSNEKVMEVREARKKAQEKAAKAAAKLGEEGPGDPNEPYSEWSAKQLKAEALRRNAERDEADQLDLSGITKKEQLAEALQKDDDGADEGDGQEAASSDPQ